MVSWYLSYVKKSLLILLFSLIIVSCNDDAEEYPFEQSPYVEFDDLVFRDTDQLDTLELSFILWDRERDIGFTSSLEDQNRPFHYAEIIIDDNDQPVKISGDYTPPFFKTPIFFSFSEPAYFTDQKIPFSETDNRGAYTCANYEIIELDTFFIERNKYYYNVHVDFIDDEGDEIDFELLFSVDDCSVGNFNLRLNPLEEIDFFETFDAGTFRIERRGRYSWGITYKMTSAAFKLALQGERFGIELLVNDRELNESNTISSGLVTLEEITN